MTHASPAPDGAVNRMVQAPGGRIVNVSSVMGRFALPGSGHVRRTQSRRERTCTG